MNVLLSYSQIDLKENCPIHCLPHIDRCAVKLVSSPNLWSHVIWRSCASNYPSKITEPIGDKKVEYRITNLVPL